MRPPFPPGRGGMAGSAPELEEVPAGGRGNARVAAAGSVHWQVMARIRSALSHTPDFNAKHDRMLSDCHTFLAKCDVQQLSCHVREKRTYLICAADSMKDCDGLSRFGTASTIAIGLSATYELFHRESAFEARRGCSCYIRAACIGLSTMYKYIHRQPCRRFVFLVDPVDGPHCAAVASLRARPATVCLFAKQPRPNLKNRRGAPPT